MLVETPFRRPTREVEVVFRLKMYSDLVDSAYLLLGFWIHSCLYSYGGKPCEGPGIITINTILNYYLKHISQARYEMVLH